MYEDPSAEAVRFNSTNFVSFGPPDQPSCLAESHRSYGNLRQTANTRPTPSPAFYPPERTVTVPPEKSDYTWTWPERKERPPAPRLKRCAGQRRGCPPARHVLRASSGVRRPVQAHHTSFLEEYELRPPWLKY